MSKLIFRKLCLDTVLSHGSHKLRCLLRWLLPSSDRMKINRFDCMLISENTIYRTSLICIEHCTQCAISFRKSIQDITNLFPRNDVLLQLSSLFTYNVAQKCVKSDMGREEEKQVMHAIIEIPRSFPRDSKYGGENKVKLLANDQLPFAAV